MFILKLSLFWNNKSNHCDNIQKLRTKTVKNKNFVMKAQYHTKEWNQNTRGRFFKLRNHRKITVGVFYSPKLSFEQKVNKEG